MKSTNPAPCEAVGPGGLVAGHFKSSYKDGAQFPIRKNKRPEQRDGFPRGKRTAVSTPLLHIPPRRVSPEERGGYSSFPIPCRGPNSHKEWYLRLHEVEQRMSNPHFFTFAHTLRMRPRNSLRHPGARLRNRKRGLPIASHSASEDPTRTGNGTCYSTRLSSE